MSYNGIMHFVENLGRLMNSKAFKDADPGTQLQMGGRLMRSKYGLGLFGGVKPLPPPPERAPGADDE